MHIRDDAEFGETTKIGIVGELNVGDDRPTVATGIVGYRVLDRVERLPDRGVTDGVDVDLKTQLIDAAGRFGQRIALPGPQTVTVQT